MKNGRIFLFILTLFISSNFIYSKSDMKRSTIAVKKDYGPIVYAEDYYRLYSLPLYFNEQDLLQNIVFLKDALNAPFDFVNRALTIIKTEDEYQKYKDLMHMQFNYLITQNYIYIAALYDKQNYYFYNSQFKEDIKKSYEYAVYFYKLAEERWVLAKEYALKVTKNKSKIEMDNLIDKAWKIRLGEIDYSKTATRQLKHIDDVLYKIETEAE